MGAISDLYRGTNNYDIVGRRRIWLTVAVIASVLSIVSLVVIGLNLSIDFKGGTVWKYSYAHGAGATDGRDGANGVKPSEGDVRAAIERAGVAPEKILFLGGDQIEVQAGAVDAVAARGVSAELAGTVGVSAENAPNLVSSTTISATWGGQVSSKALRALVIFLIAVSIYISWRFEWKMAVAAFAALAHDILLTVGFYSVTRFTVAPATVIATLTILGYSLYDDVVVFDKLKESSKLASGLRRDYAQLVNDSLNQVLMRSLNTSFSTLLPIGALLFGGVAMGSETLKNFALALFVGVLAGTYSSIFIATPIIVMLGRPGSTSQAAMKVARRMAEEDSKSQAVPKNTRTKRPTAERMAEIVGDEPDETDYGEEVPRDETEDDGPQAPSPKKTAGPSSGKTQPPRQASKSKKGRPRGSRPAGGGTKKRKKR